MNADGSGLTRLTYGEFFAWSPLPAATATPTPATTLSPPGWLTGATATQKELNENAQKIYKNCSISAPYNQFHDCRCIEKQYLDRGIMGSIPQELQMEIASTCVNEAGVAAYYYRQCKQRFPGESGLVTAKALGISNIEEHCTCRANAMAKNYAKEPSLYSQHILNLHKAANRSCKDKETAASPAATMPTAAG